MIARTLLAGLIGLAACGYTSRPGHGQARVSGGALPALAVLPFDNATFRRGLEIRLTRLVADEWRSRGARTPAPVSSADWILKGTIVRAEERVYSEDRDDRIRESSIIVTVDVVLEERASGEVLGTNSFVERAPFSTRAGRIASVEQAQEEALRDLAEQIVYWLESRKAKTS